MIGALVAIFDFIAARPRLAAVLSAISLLDLSRCIALGHSDWPIPAVTAFGLACLVRPGERDGEDA